MININISNNNKKLIVFLYLFIGFYNIQIKGLMPLIDIITVMLLFIGILFFLRRKLYIYDVNFTLLGIMTILVIYSLLIVSIFLNTYQFTDTPGMYVVRMMLTYISLVIFSKLVITDRIQFDDILRIILYVTLLQAILTLMLNASATFQNFFLKNFESDANLILSFKNRAIAFSKTSVFSFPYIQSIGLLIIAVLIPNIKSITQCVKYSIYFVITGVLINQ